jgi:four helix bundle protein
MIAEAWAKRRYEAAFFSKVNDALGEATETQSWLDHALDSRYITSAQFKELDVKWQQIGAMLNKMTERAHDFCKSQTR